MGAMSSDLITHTLAITSRQVTGGTWHYGYVIDRSTGRYVAACTHKHGSQALAEDCGKRMLSQYRKGRRWKLYADAPT